MVIVFIGAFVFFTLTLAFFLGRLLGSTWAGFGYITLLYLLLSLFNRAFKLRIEKVLIRVLIQRVFKHNSNRINSQ
jgi:hypothetical protein